MKPVMRQQGHKRLATPARRKGPLEAATDDDKSIHDKQWMG